MAIADHLPNKGRSNQGLVCSVRTLLTTLEGEALEELVRYLADDSISHSALERAIRADGHYVGVGTIGKHRRGDCRCFPA